MDKQQIVKEVMEKMFSEHQVPGHIHLKVINELKRIIKEHETSTKASQERDEKYLKELGKFSRGFAEYEKELERLKNTPQVKGAPGLPGKDGYTPKRGVDYFDGADGKNGKDGRDGESVDINMLVNMVLGKINVPEQKIDLEKLYKEFIERIHKDKSLKTSALGDMDTFLFNIRSTGKNKRYKVEEMMHGGGGGVVYVSDLTSQCDGVTKIFTIPNFTNALQLTSTQFPITYRPLIDWNAAGATLTLTSEVGPPEAGQTLLFMYS